MKYRKNSIWLILIIVILIFVIVLQKHGTSLGASEKNISFSGKKFNYIEIKYQNQELKLYYKDGKWESPEASDIDVHYINKLANALMSIEIQSTVASKETETLKSQIKENGHAIAIYMNKKLLYSISVGKDNQRNYVQTSRGKLYYIQLKGYGNQLLSELLTPEVNLWEERMLLNFAKDEINSILIEYPTAPQKSFKLTNSSDSLNIIGASGEQLKNIDLESANDYLHFFKGIHYEQLDTLKNKPSSYLFRMVIKTNGAKHIQIDGFKLLDASTQKENLNSFSGILNNSAMVRLNYSDFDPILVDKSYFQKK